MSCRSNEQKRFVVLNSPSLSAYVKYEHFGFNAVADAHAVGARRHGVVSIVYRMFDFPRIRMRMRVRMQTADCLHVYF